MKGKIIPLILCFSVFSSMVSVDAKEVSSNTGTSYYVDSIDGDDGNDGLSEAQAFKTLSKINEIKLNPGDSVLLKKGSEFYEQLKPMGSGEQDNRITITSYGDGDKKPIINGMGKKENDGVNGSNAAVLIENMNHVIMSDLEITNDDVFNQTSDKDDPNNMKGNNKRRIGVHITINEDAPTFNKSQRAWGDITVKNCYIHDVDGDENRASNKINGGIGVEVFFRNDNKVYPYFDGVTLDSNVIEQVDRTGIKGIRLTELTLSDTDGGDGIRHDAIRVSEDKNQAGRNFVVKNNILKDIGGDGILIDSTKGALVERNVLYDHTKRSRLANAGIWCWNTIDTTFQYNESYGGPVNNQDGCSYDCDYNSAGTIFQYNYSHDTPLGFMLLMGGNEMDIVRYNISQNDGTAWRHFSGDSTTKSYVYNNVFYYDGAKWEWSKGSEDLKNNYEFYNNVFYNYSTTTPTNWGSKMDWSKAVFGSNAVYEASNKVGENEIEGALHIDPKFNDAGKAETEKWDSLSAYQISKDSQLVNNGSYVYLDFSGAKLLGDRDHYTAKKDFYGNPLYKGAPDIGVHEVQDTVEKNITIEDNATYRIISSIDQKYLQGNDKNVILNDKKQDNQEFILVNSKDGYKLKLLGSSSEKLYLALDNGNICLSENDSTIWKITDLKNGLVSISSDGKYLSQKDGKISLVPSKDANSEWKLDYVDSSKSFNTGGEKVEGYSKDQLWDEKTSTPGRYGDNKVITDSQTSDDVYSTAVVGKEIGYKFPIKKGSYNIKLSFKELESVKNRTFDIIVNGNVYANQYKVDAQKDLEIPEIPAKDGFIDIKLVAAYNEDGTKTDAILNGITLEKSAMNETNFLLNCGGVAVDGLSSDASYPTNGSGHYGNSNEITVARPSIDGGMPSAMESAREGEDFGYKFKAQPGSYRLKCLFNDGQEGTPGRVFDIYVNGELVKKDFNLDQEAGSRKTGVDFTKIISSKNGLIDVQFKGKNNTKALVNAILIDKISSYETRENILLNKNTEQSSQEGNLSSNYAVDGNQATRWGSGWDNNQYITVDLEKKYMLDTVYIDWTPGAYATKYRVETSIDGNNWEQVEYVTGAQPGLNIITFEPTEAKYLRIFGETRNSGYGMSITELEAFGTEVKGESHIEGVVSPLKDNTYLMTLKALDIYKRYTTMNVDIEYDANDVEYVGDEEVDLNSNLHYVEKDVKNNGKLNYSFEIKNADAFLNQADFMNVKLKTEKRRVPVKVTVTLSDPAAHATVLPEMTVYLNNEVTKDELLDLINKAGELLNSSIVGIKPGEYQQDVADTFKNVIDQAKDICQNNEEDKYSDTFNSLEKAIQVFKDSANTEKYAYYHRDYTNDKTAEYELNNSSVNVSDDKLHVQLKGNEATATVKEAVDINEGIFDIKFDIDNLQDQIRFDIKNTDTSRIEVGYEDGYWIWGGAIDGSWGYFPRTANDDLFVDKTNHVIIKFTKSDDQKTKVDLTVNGNHVGSITEKFKDDKGDFRFWTRYTAKNIYVHEVTYTNAPVYTIESTCSQNGTLDVLGTTDVYAERSKTIKFIPDEGYEVSKVTVDGKEVEFKDNEYTFDYVIENHNIHVEFAKQVVNKTGLQSLIDEIKAKNLVESNYIQESWDKFSEALNQAETVMSDNNATQKAVDEMITTLQEACDGLVEKGDKTGLQTLIDEIESKNLDENNYTQESWDKYSEALNQAKTVMSNNNAIQADVDKALSALTNSYNALALKAADYTKIDKLMEDINKLDLNKYTEDSVNALQAAIDGIDRDLTILDQDDVDKMFTTLNDAYTKLVEKGDKTELQTLIDSYKDIDLDNYQDNGKNEFKQAYQNALNVLDDENATQETVNNTVKALTDSYKVLVLKPADYSQINNLLAEINKLDLNKYTEDSVKALKAAMDGIKTDLTILYQSEVDDMFTALQEACNGLVEKGDKTGLKAKIDEIEAKKLVENNYTQELWDKYSEALNQAKAVMSNNNATQKMVDDMLAALQDAYKGLTAKEVVNKEELKTLIDEVEAKKLDENNYTQESWAKYSEALNQAKAVMSNNNATQKMVDDTLAALQDAYKGLTAKEVVNKEELKTLIDDIEAEKLDKNNYTQESWAKYSEALNKAKTVMSDSNATKEAVNKALSTLSKSYQALALKPADYTQIDKLMEEINKLELDVYTKDSVNALQAAIDEIDHDLTILDQDKANKMYKALQKAFDELKIKENINKEELKALIDSYKDIDLDNYQDKGKKEFEQAYQEAMKVLNDENATQETVNNIVKTLTDSYKKLALKAADYTQIDNLLTEIKKLDLDKYTEDSVKALQAAIDGIDYDLTILDQDKADKMYKALQKAFNELKIKESVNKEELKTLIDEVEAKKLDKNNYTQESWDKYNEALKQAQMVMSDSNATKEAVNKALTTLSESYQALALKTADYTQIDKLMEEINKLDLDKYTEDSVKALQAVIDGIDHDLTILDQDKADKMYKALQKAFDELKIKESVNKEELKALIDSYKDIDLDNYQDKGKKEFEQAYQEAIKVLNDKNATQSEIDNAISRLLNAKKALKENDVVVKEDPKKEDQQNSHDKDNHNVKTGDYTNMTYPMALMSMAVMILCILKKKSFKKH